MFNQLVKQCVTCDTMLCELISERGVYVGWLGCRPVRLTVPCRPMALSSPGVGWRGSQFAMGTQRRDTMSYLNPSLAALFGTKSSAT